jgi:hypothetical protein
MYLLVAYAALLAGCINLAPPTRTDGDALGGVDGGDGGTDGMSDGGPPDAPAETVPEAGRDVMDVPPETKPSTLGVGLAGYWKLDEGSGIAVATDSSGNRNNGAITGSPGRVTSGLPPGLDFADPGAFSFGAPTGADAVAVPDSMSLRPDAISIAVWVKLASLTAASTCGSAPNTMQYIVHRRNTRGSVGMFEGVALMKETAGTFGLLLSNNFGQQDLVHSTTRPVAGTWYHVVATADGASRMQLYVNGRLEGTTPHSDPIAYDMTRPLFIGRTGECGDTGQATWDATLDGTLDEVRIYNRELTDGEVMQLAGGAQ